ncbi:MAG: amidohydrolase family protein, partial [Emcibacter sp.]|nr:amidohydrolase family protein [Emcibacter sp.]
MKKILCKFLGIMVVVSGIFSNGALAEKTDHWSIIHAGTLMADARKKATSAQSIIVKNGKIYDIRAGYISSSDLPNVKNANIIDLKDQFVMAGMIDSHTHVTGQMAPHSREQAVTTTNSEYALIGSVYARRILNAGFTTIRNVGGPREAVFALRNSIRKGQILGPRIVA